MARLEVRRLLIPLAPVAGGCKSPSVHSRLADLSVKVPRDVTPGFAEIQFFRVSSSLGALMASSVLASCAADVAIKNPSTLMVDCQFQAKTHVHMHVYEDRGAVTLITGYTPGKERSHFEDLRTGVQSNGRLISSAGDRLAVEMFLLNENFDAKPGEVVLIRVAQDGQSKVEARAVGGVVRTIDTGTCTMKGSTHA
jgi:hypothetical protein